MSLIQIAHNAVHAKLINADRDVKLVVSELLSYQVEGAEFSDTYKSGTWSGRSSFFEFKNASFPAGFVNLVYSELKRRGHTVQMIKPRLPAANGPEFPVVDTFGEDPRYDYQRETVRRLLRYGSMIAMIATGGGKSRIAKLAYSRIKRPTLFLTTRSVLMYQMKDAFEELGLTVGVMGDGHWEPRRSVNVAMVQTLTSALQGPGEKDRGDDARRKLALQQKTVKLLEMFELVIGEEAHESGGNSYYYILQFCRNAHYRLALTATPFMRQDEESNMRLMACFGPIGIQVSEKTLIDRGILARPIFKRIREPVAPLGVRRSSAWQRAYDLGIVNNAWRNGQIAIEAVRAVRYGLPVMILVQRKVHGAILKKLIATSGVKVEYIFGDTDQEARTRALQRLKNGEIEVLIGSTILDVGVDVPAVGMVILGGGGKAEIALRQRIGRGLRSKKDGPNICLVIDFTDHHNNHLKGHAITRGSIIDSTPGFAENVLPAGEDFDFGTLGFTKIAA